MFPYPIKGSRCKLAQARLQYVGMYTEGMRLSTLWLFEDNIGDWRISTMFKNFICIIRDTTMMKDNTGKKYIGVSLSPESNAWRYDHETDLPAVQRKADQDFFLERLRDFMTTNKLYLVAGSDEIVHVMDGLKRSVEHAFKRICTTQNQLDIEESLFGYLASLPEWAPSILRYGRIFMGQPDLKGMLPRARVVYEVLEFEDGFWAMFPDFASVPLSLPFRKESDLAYTLLGKSDATLEIIDAILNHTYSDTKRASTHGKTSWSGAAMATRAFCAHGFRTPVGTPAADSDRPCSTSGMISHFNGTPPHAWFKAIGKYAVEPMEKTVEFPMKDFDYRGKQDLPWNRKGILKTPHLGWKEWIAICEMLRACMFRPKNTRGPWLNLQGPSSTGKTTLVSFLKHYYPVNVQCAAKGGFATSDVNASKRVVMFEEFRGKETIPKVQDFLRLTDVGTMQIEGKRQNSTIAENNAVKVVDSNTTILSWYKPVDEDPLNMRFKTKLLYLKVKEAVCDENLSSLVEKQWLSIVNYLGARHYLDPVGKFRRPTDKLTGTQLPVYAGNFASKEDFIDFGVPDKRHRGTTTRPGGGGKELGLADAEHFFMALVKPQNVGASSS